MWGVGHNVRLCLVCLVRTFDTEHGMEYHPLVSGTVLLTIPKGQGMATRQKSTDRVKTFKITASIGEAINSLVRDTLTAQGKGAALASRVVEALKGTKNPTIFTLAAWQLIRDRVKADVLAMRPEWGSVEGKTAQAVAERKARAAKVRTTVHRIMQGFADALEHAGVSVEKTERIGGRVGGKTDAEGRTSKTDAARAIDAIVAQDADIVAQIDRVRAHLLASVESGDHVAVIVAAERIMKLQDAE